MNNSIINSELEKKDELKENYWAGFFDGSRGTLKEDGLKLFLKSRNLFFDLNVFHPIDAEVIRQSVEYKRGKFENCASIKTVKDMPFISYNLEEFIGDEALLKLDSLYGNIKKGDCFEPDFYYLYQKLMTNNPKFLDSDKKLFIRKLSERAVSPKKNNCLEAGYTLCTPLNSNSPTNSTTTNLETLHDTYLCVQAPYGYYMEIYPHPKLLEFNHSFVNPSPIIINRKERIYESIKIKLKKKSETVPDLPEKTPIALLIPRLACHFPIEEIVL